MGIVKFWTRALDFTGRSSRAEFWLGYLVDVVGVLFLTTHVAVYERLEEYTVLMLVQIVILLWMYLAMLTSAVRRLRDAGKNPLFVLLFFVPIGNFVLLAFLLMPTAEQNRY